VRHLLGEPFDPVIVGPSSAYWGREPGDEGRTLYATTDGGTTAPPQGVVRTPPADSACQSGGIDS
jgi:hypothetical protein